MTGEMKTGKPFRFRGSTSRLPKGDLKSPLERRLGVVRPSGSLRGNAGASQRPAGGTPLRVAFFGHFDSSNFGNAASLEAMIFNLDRMQPDAQAICITTGPAAAAAAYGVEAVGIERTLLQSWTPRSRFVQILRRALNGVLSEPYQWIRAARTLARVDMLVIPGTGLLTDAYGLRNWGPYGLLRWAALAKIRRRRLMFVSVGAGPLNTVVGRFLARRILSLADYRSYRDSSTKDYLKEIGFDVGADPVCPDLAFSLPEPATPHRAGEPGRRTIGLGVMHSKGRYVEEGDEVDANYLATLVVFGVWLIEQGYDIRILSGDIGDDATRDEFRRLLRRRLSDGDDRRIINEPIASVADLRDQISETDLVVATRFHNALLSIANDKPTIAIAFHHKCVSLMNAVGMSRYCLDIEGLSAEALIDAFRDLEANRTEILPALGRTNQAFREQLAHQYRGIFTET